MTPQTDKITNSQKTERALTLAVLTGFLSLTCNVQNLQATEFQGHLSSISITDATASNAPPVAHFTYTQDGTTVTCDASSSTGSDGTISEYNWNFGDGGTATGSSVSYQYADNTSYPITLTVKDTSGGIAIYQVQTDTCSNTIVNSASDSASLVIYSTSKNETLGQSFVGNGKQLCSITVRPYSLTGDTTTLLTARVGSSQNLSSSYSEADVSLLPTQAGADIKFTWANGPTLVKGQTYYFMIHNPGSKWSSRVDLQATNSSSYSDGIAQYGIGWTTTGYSNISWDLSFEIGTK